VNDGKNRAVGPDTEREGEDGDRGETGSFRELAEGVAKVVHGGEKVVSSE
jgi:hypothetical protein